MGITAIANLISDLRAFQHTLPEDSEELNILSAVIFDLMNAQRVMTSHRSLQNVPMTISALTAVRQKHEHDKVKDEEIDEVLAALLSAQQTLSSQPFLESFSHRIPF
eukprot:c13747_g1_i1.p1 GENE.c13747_g1_i1~~c13747_g1_i1.p1  ORF type:complete len:107 (-),score=16.79 c13747_g1_i1:3-323(-)